MATSSRPRSDEKRTGDGTSAARSGAVVPERTRARETTAVGDPEAQVDRVAMVSRRKDGEPDQGTGYEVLHHERATDADRDAAENVTGRRAGRDGG